MRLDAITPKLLPYVLTLGFLGTGALVGLVVASGKLVLIALVIGGVTGLLLLNALPVVVWLLLIGVLLVNGPVAYFTPELSKVTWLFSLLGVFMSGAALLYSVAGRERPVRPVPIFVYLALAFAGFAIVAALFSNGPLAEITAGAKRQFQFWGVILLFALVPFSETNIRRWVFFLLGVAIVQLPFTLYQRILLVPQVMGWEMPNFVPFDIVVGTFEGSMYGGGASAIMAMYQVVAFFALLCAYRERLIGVTRFLLLAAAIALPLGLGETKIVLFLMPVTMLFAFYDTVFARPLAFIGAMLLTVAVAAVLAYLYFMVQVAADLDWRDTLEMTFAYNFGERGYYGTGVNRLTAIPYWFESQTWAEPMRTLFGYGVGSSYGVDGRAQSGHMFVAHAGMFIDLVAISLLLWDFGLVGTLLYLGVVIGGMVAAARCLSEAVSAWDRTFCRTLLASLGASMLMMFYSASVVVLVSHGFLIALTLGLVAWRARHGPMALPVGRAAPVAQGPAARKGRSRWRRREMFPQPAGSWPGETAPGFPGRASASLRPDAAGGQARWGATRTGLRRRPLRRDRRQTAAAGSNRSSTAAQ